MNYGTQTEMTKVVGLMSILNTFDEAFDALNPELPEAEVTFAVNIYDVNGDTLGSIQCIGGDYIYYPWTVTP